MKKVLLIGNGAREHALAETILKSKDTKLYAFMSKKNPGIAKISSEYAIADLSDFDELKRFCEKVKPDIAMIGPEWPLDIGIVDFLETINIPAIGPKKEQAKLETSKSFTRKLMKKYNIEGNPIFRSFESSEGIWEFMSEIDEVVIKPDGLTGGKGVKVQGDHFDTKEQALAYCTEVLESHPSVIVEEKLEGEEFSLQCLTDGITVIDSPPVQDHKRAYNGDKGPNTGGMGSYSCEDHLLPFLKKEDIEAAHRITEKVAQAIYKETGQYYVGIMYGGFIVTKNGVKLIEYNARFGDPEAMNVLPLLKTDCGKVCEAMVNHKLADIKLEFEKKATVCKYAVPEGYPEDPVEGKKVELDKDAKAKVYYASVNEKNGEIFMSSSRAIAFVGIADTIQEAEKIAEEAISNVKGPVFHRTDIGTKKLLQRRVEHMKELLNDE